MLNLENCSICNSNEIILHKKVDKFLVLKCKKCGLIWVNNAVEEVVPNYDETYFNNSNSKIGYNDYLKSEKNHRRNARNIIKKVSKFRKLTNLKILDIGSAFGFLLDEAGKTAVCDINGIELSGYACEYARTQLKLNILNKELVPDCFPPETFDIVFMIGTIEHLISPKEIVAVIKTILKPGGLLIISTIDTAGFFPLYSIKPPEHLFYFNHKNLTNLLNKFDFNVLSVKTYFVNYYLYDLFYRFGEFFSLNLLVYLSKYIEKLLPNFYLNIPTNEMLVIAEVSKTGIINDGK